ncbi:aspartate--tRNA ligase [Patescibacteria group bacterium]|nr:aspartate--tRNA ligase [Patescibacteria group bacterium]
MKRIWAKQATKKINSTIKLCGWINTKRSMGEIVFIDLRDRSGIIQIVFVEKELDQESRQTIKEIRNEFVVEIEGIVNKRPLNQINKNIVCGEIEVLAKKITILSKAKTPVFEINNEKLQANEEMRLKYRYLDLRHERMKDNLVLRHKITKTIRDFLDKEDFLEVETPILTKGTPEGAREYIVPSRLYPGEFYVLPQAPQQFKQLLMVGGIEKYFQIARCFRDEDTRGDRQPEFTQIDIEMSFISQSDILDLIEKMIIEIIKKTSPQKKITKIPFPRITYKQAMTKYKSDKPDIRQNKNDKDELAFCFITDFPLFSPTNSKKGLTSTHHPFTSPIKKDIKTFVDDPLNATALQYDLACNGMELGGGSIRIHKRETQEKIFKILKLSDKEIKRRFNHLLNAFEYGVPPHGGVALGLDRIAMMLANEKNIREVIAFPKTSDARDLMMGAPSEIPAKQIKESNIKIINEKK